MIYFANWDSMNQSWGPWWGVFRSPRRPNFGCIERSGRLWAGDNDAFHGLFDPAAFARFLQLGSPHRERCAFIAAPDVLSDAEATSERWEEYAPAIQAAGYRAAFVLQDGHGPRDIPREAGAVFLGGSTEYKLGAEARACVAQARAWGKWVHVGRVNSQRRIALFQAMGVDSVDGTTINRGPIIKRGQMERQLLQRALPWGPE